MKKLGMIALVLVLGSELLADRCHERRPEYCEEPVCIPCCETVSPYVFDPFPLNCENHFWMKGEVLVLLTASPNAAYAQKSTVAFEPGTTTERELTVETLSTKFDWKPGCRVALGYKFHDRMDTVLKFTYIHGHGKASATATSNAGGSTDYTTLTPFNGFGGQALGATSLFNSNLYMGDWELGRHFFTTCWLDFRPFIGLRGFYYHQKQTFFDTQENIFFIPIPTFADTSSRIQDLRKGGGIRLGFDTLWGLKYGVAAYANLSASILGVWSKTSTSRQVLLPPPPAAVNIISEIPFGALSGISELSLGLQYDVDFSYGKYHLGANAGYEFISFLNDAQFFLYGASAWVRYQGVSVGLRFDY